MLIGTVASHSGARARPDLCWDAVGDDGGVVAGQAGLGVVVEAGRPGLVALGDLGKQPEQPDDHGHDRGVEQHPGLYGHGRSGSVGEVVRRTGPADSDTD